MMERVFVYFLLAFIMGCLASLDWVTCARYQDCTKWHREVSGRLDVIEQRLDKDVE